MNKILFFHESYDNQRQPVTKRQPQFYTEKLFLLLFCTLKHISDILHTFNAYDYFRECNLLRTRKNTIFVKLKQTRFKKTQFPYFYWETDNLS